MADPDDIIQVCRAQRAVPANANDCALFVKAVCAAFGITLTGDADQIVAQLTSQDWAQHGNDGVAAADAAAAGSLGIGGMTSDALKQL